MKSSVKTLDTPRASGTFAQTGMTNVTHPLLEKEHAARRSYPALAGFETPRRMRLRLTDYSSIRLPGRETAQTPEARRKGPPAKGLTRPHSQLGDPPKLCSTDQGVCTPSVPLARKPTVW